MSEPTSAPTAVQDLETRILRTGERLGGSLSEVTEAVGGAAQGPQRLARALGLAVNFPRQGGLERQCPRATESREALLRSGLDEVPALTTTGTRLRRPGARESLTGGSGEYLAAMDIGGVPIELGSAASEREAAQRCGAPAGP